VSPKRDEVVLDSSVLGRWLIDRSGAAASSLRRGKLVAPSLILVETANALVNQVRFRSLELATARLLFANVLGLPLELVPESVLAADALVLAAELGLTAYDALYVALAAGRDLPLLTADRRLAASYHGAELVV
jgi:predicted nucleic acid-binding protein